MTRLSEKLIASLEVYHSFYPEGLVFSTAWGYSGVVLLDHARRIWDRVPVISVDTGFLFPETLNFAQYLTKAWNLDVTWSVPVESDAQPPTEECCMERKVKPMGRLLEPYQAWVTAIRHDQATTRKDAIEVEKDRWEKTRLAPMLKWSSWDCWEHINRGLLPVQPLYGLGYNSIGCSPCTSVTDGPERSGRWKGERQECGIHTKD